MESLESRVSYLEKLVRTQTDRIEMMVNFVDGLMEGFTESDEEESSSDIEQIPDFKPTCDFTDQGKIDDCGVQIDFGYGSNRDLQAFEFNNVSDEIGERILKFINEQFTNGKDISDFVREHPLSMKDDIRMPTDETIAKAKKPQPIR